MPFNVPSFGDAGQTFDPFVYLGFLAANTKQIALATGSIILPLRHPAHIAKAAMTADVLSGGRLILGVASGDRPDEYPAMNISFENRGEKFRESFAYIRNMSKDSPAFTNAYGSLNGSMDMLPKPTTGKLPMIVTGGSQQDLDWITEHSDGWLTYPRNTHMMASLVKDYRGRLTKLAKPNQPVLQPLYVDLVEDPDAYPKPIHLGLRLGTNYLLEYLKSLEEIGINSVGLNLRFNQADTEKTMERLAKEILPHFK